MQEHRSRGTSLARHKSVKGKPGIYFRPRADGKGGVLPPAPPYAIGYEDSTGKAVGPIGGYLTVTDAEAARRAVLGRMDGGQRVVNSSITWSDMFDAWLATPRPEPLSESTLRTYRGTAEKWIKPVLGRKRIGDISRDELLTVIRKATTGGLGPWSMNTVRVVLSGTFQEAIARGIIGVSPMGRIRKNEWPRKAKRKILHLEPEEIELLLAACEGWFYYAVLVSIFSGLRSAELRGLRWEDVDFKNGILHVNGQMLREGRVEKLKSKLEGEGREVYMSKRLSAALAEWKLKSGGGDGLVFPSDASATGGFHSSPLRRRFKRALTAAGLPERRWHDLRHTFASILINNGMEGQQVQKQMGHASVITTYETYSHLWARRNTQEAYQAAFDRAGLG